MPIISFSSVSKTYPKEIGIPSNTALDNLSFDIKQGETLGLIGVNGAGKSTTIRLLMDFIRPNSGTIKLFHNSPSLPQQRRKIGYLPEVANFPSNITVLDLLRFTGTACEIPRHSIEDRSQELLTLLDLWEVRRRPLSSYSKGMQQRANFAIALINDPELLILDEPMSGLDPIGRKKIIDLIDHLKNTEKTILFCSHILEDVDRLASNILLLHKGRKLFLGKPEDLVHQEGQASMADAFVSLVRKEDAGA
jgi:ABC-2 type transport system ATP-binding protein